MTAHEPGLAGRLTSQESCDLLLEKLGGDSFDEVVVVIIIIEGHHLTNDIVLRHGSDDGDSGNGSLQTGAG